MLDWNSLRSDDKFKMRLEVGMSQLESLVSDLSNGHNRSKQNKLVKMVNLESQTWRCVLKQYTRAL